MTPVTSIEGAHHVAQARDDVAVALIPIQGAGGDRGLFMTAGRWRYPGKPAGRAVTAQDVLGVDGMDPGELAERVAVSAAVNAHRGARTAGLVTR